MYYIKLIQEILEERDRTDISPDAILGFMRLKYGTLDHLSRDEFKAEIDVGIMVADNEGVEELNRMIYFA